MSTDLSALERKNQLYNKRWEHFPHGSDVGVRGIGHSLQEAFEMAAIAMTSVVVADPTSIADEKVVKINCSAIDIYFLLYEFLNSIIYEMDTKQMLFSKFIIRTMNETSLQANLYGEGVDIKKHQPAVDLKGATMTDLQVKQVGDFWIAQCIVDV